MLQFMRPQAPILATMLVLLTPSFSACAEDELTLSIAVDRRDKGVAVIDSEKPFRVVLSNNTDKVIHIPNPSSRAGYYCLTLRSRTSPSEPVLVTSKRQINDAEYFEAIAEDRGRGSRFIAIQPSETVTLQVGLSEFAWGTHKWNNRPAPNSGVRYSIQAQYQSTSKGSPESPVWTGTTVSPPVQVQIVSDQINTPQEYLWNGFPDSALRIMKAQPDWVRRQDEDQRTPLHVAARFKHVGVVNWLLENGANVNATAYNGFTPLHLTSDPAVVEAILKHDPDLSIACRIQGRTPLQEAAASMIDARTDGEKNRWKSIVELYRAAGAEYDILTAIDLNDVDRVKAILADSPKPDNDRFRSPLRRAASLGRLAMCRLLVEKYGHDVNQFDQGSGYPIVKSALQHPEIVELLIENGADLKRRITWQSGRTGVWIIGDDATSLHHAAADGASATIRLLLDAGVDLFATTRDSFNDEESNQTALDVAALFGKADNMFALINHRQFKEAAAARRQALLDRCLISAASPSGLARDANRTKLLRVLLHSGANPDATDSNGHTGIQMAASDIHPTGHVEETDPRTIIRILRAHGATLDLFSAVAIGDETELAEILKRSPKSINARRPDGYPALHVAVGMNYIKVVAMLLEAGADVSIRNESDETGTSDGTALHSAAFWGRDEIAVLLIKSGADINARGKSGSTPLHSAARMTNVAMVKVLLDNGAIINAKDDDGETPLDWCQALNWTNAVEVQKLLRKHGAK